MLGPEADHGFVNNLGALCKKKANQFRREKKVFAYELLVPGLIILGGILLTRVQWYSRSAPKLLTPELLPLPQKLLVNSHVLDDNYSDLAPKDLISSLPSQSAWDVYYEEERLSFNLFNDAALQFSRTNCSSEPYFNNAFQIFQANKRV